MAGYGQGVVIFDDSTGKSSKVSSDGFLKVVGTSGDSIIGRTYIAGSAEPVFSEAFPFGAAQAGTIIKSPAPGKRILLRGVAFNTAAVGAMFISGDQTGKTITPTFTFAAGGGAVLSDPLGIWQGSVDVAISIRSNISGAHGVVIWGTEN